MISYRELSTRAAGRLPRVSDTKSRPAAHRVTALVLSAVLMAALSAPAFAETHPVDIGDIPITANVDGSAGAEQDEAIIHEADDALTVKDSPDSVPAQEPVVITPAGVPGIEFSSARNSRVRVRSKVRDDTMLFTTLRCSATLRTTLGQLQGLKEQGITQITFRTLLHTTTLSIDTLLALGGDDAAVVLTHDGKTARLTVGGVVE